MFVVGHGSWNREGGRQSSNVANNKEYNFLLKLMDVHYLHFLSSFLCFMYLVHPIKLYWGSNFGLLILRFLPNMNHIWVDESFFACDVWVASRFLIFFPLAFIVKVIQDWKRSLDSRSLAMLAISILLNKRDRDHFSLWDQMVQTDLPSHLHLLKAECWNILLAFFTRQCRFTYPLCTVSGSAS